MKLNLIITAITPGIALCMFFYFIDRYDREPIRVLVKVFLLGMLSIIPAVLIENVLSMFNVFAGIFKAAYTAFIVAGFTEELVKRQVVVKTVFLNPVFNEKLDGIVYCVFSALGFATLENIMYVVFRFPDMESVGLYRAVLSVPAHMLFAVTMGYYLSLAKFATSSAKSAEFYKKSLTVPMLLHGIFDFILMSGLNILMALFFPFVIYMWVVNMKKLNKYYNESKNENNRNYW